MGRNGDPDDRFVQTYETLRELIVLGHLAPGTRIVEAHLAEELSVSRTPVRSALQRLQQEGYIVMSPDRRKSRTVVAPLTRDDASELFGIVGEIEGLCARRAAAAEKGVREELVAELQAINKDLLACLGGSQPDKGKIFELDSWFHRRYVIAGAGPRLMQLHKAVKPQAERYIRIYINALVDRIGESVEEHTDTVEAIASGSLDEAQHAVQVNWRHAASRLCEVIQEGGERGNWAKFIRSPSKA